MTAVRVLALLVALATLAGACRGDDGDDDTGATAPSGSTGAPVPPTGPDAVAGAPGTLISAEEVDQDAVPEARAWLVRYWSETATGQPAEVSGFVLAPAEGGTDRPVVAFAHPTTGSADACAPSLGLADAGPPVDADHPGTSVEATFAQFAHFVQQGYVVAATDYIGLGTPGPHPYLHGPSEGRSVLDAARSAAEVPDSGAGDRIVAYGWSQGGHAALWAAQLAPTWAPGLDVAGVVAAAPFSEAPALLPLIRLVPEAAGLYVLAVLGQVAADPGLDPTLVLSAAALDAAAVVEEACLAGVTSVYAGIARDGGVATGDPATAPGWADQFDEIVAGLTPLGAPALVLQGDRDLLVLSGTTRTLVERLCGHGDPVESLVLEGAGHDDIVVAADPDLRAWIDARLTAGRPPPSSC